MQDIQNTCIIRGSSFLWYKFHLNQLRTFWLNSQRLRARFLVSVEFAWFDWALNSGCTRPRTGVLESIPPPPLSSEYWRGVSHAGTFPKWSVDAEKMTHNPALLIILRIFILHFLLSADEYPRVQSTNIQHVLTTWAAHTSMCIRSSQLSVTSRWWDKIFERERED